MFGFKRRKAERVYVTSFNELNRQANKYLKFINRGKHETKVCELVIPANEDESPLRVYIHDGFCVQRVEVVMYNTVLCYEQIVVNVFGDDDFIKVTDPAERSLMIRAYERIGQAIDEAKAKRKQDAVDTEARRQKYVDALAFKDLTKDVVFGVER